MILKKQKKKLKKFKSNPIREECGVFGIHNFTDASTITALGLHALQPVSYTHLTLPTKA